MPSLCKLRPRRFEQSDGCAVTEKGFAMAEEISFTAPTLFPGPEFRNRVPEITEKRAEALSATYELLEVARDCEAIDLLQGLVGARKTLMEELAEFASKPAAVAALRNLIVAGKILGAVDSEVLSKFSRQLNAEPKQAEREKPPPSLWQITKQANHPDVRRGLSFILNTLGMLGQAVMEKPNEQKMTGSQDAKA